VQGEEDRHFGGQIDKGPDRGKGVLQRSSKILAAMCRQENGALRRKIGGRSRMPRATAIATEADPWSCIPWIAQRACSRVSFTADQAGRPQAAL